MQNSDEYHRLRYGEYRRSPCYICRDDTHRDACDPTVPAELACGHHPHDYHTGFIDSDIRGDEIARIHAKYPYAFGLVLAIAIVVDDAIVVVEDCSRLVDEGTLSPRDAARKAMVELQGPVVGEVLVLLSVFIPTAFISGITGELYKQFALTIAVSTAFSGFNALTFTPAMCALFLRKSKSTRFSSIGGLMPDG